MPIIKSVYVWQNLVRPKKRTFTYGFLSAGSVAQMQTDWWDFYRNSGTATWWREFTTNGLHNTYTWSTNKKGAVQKIHGLDFSTAKKIQISVDHYLVSWSWNGASNFWITDNNGFSIYGNIYSENNSGYNWYGTGVTWSAEKWNRVSLSTGNYIGTLIIDLVNKTVTMKISNRTDVVDSLSDSQIESIRNCTQARVFFDNVWNYYKDITVTWE